MHLENIALNSIIHVCNEKIMAFDVIRTKKCSYPALLNKQLKQSPGSQEWMEYSGMEPGNETITHNNVGTGG